MTSESEKQWTCLDVAAYCLRALGPMSAMKLQKLVYYCQAWHLALFERPLFLDEIQAWVYGPVAPNLYAHHRGQFVVTNLDEKIEVNDLSARVTLFLDAVLHEYGSCSAGHLVELTHGEKPWQAARQEPDGYPDTSVISIQLMKDFFCGHPKFLMMQEKSQLSKKS